MLDLTTGFAIGVLGLASYALHVGGFLAGSAIPEKGNVARFFRLAPGNLFIAFVAAAGVEGGRPSVIGCGCALLTLAATRREWAAISAGFAAALGAATCFR